jgi:hypothetical protein
MIFKSFDQFITESTSANLVPINESRYGSKFKVTVNTPQPGETYNLSFSAVINPGKSQPNYLDTEDQIIDMAKGYAEENLPGSAEFQYASEARDSDGNPAAVIFIREKTLRQRKVINNRVLFDADLYFKSSDSFKSPDEIKQMITNLEIQPYMEVNPTKGALKKTMIWDIKDMGSLLKGAKSDTDKLNKDSKFNPNAGSNDQLNNNTGATTTTTTVKPLVASAAGPAAFPVVSGATLIKKGESASEDIRKLQKMIMAGAIANTEPKYKKAADLVRTHGGADGKYGGQTALAIGTLLDTPTVKYNPITPEVENSLKAALSAVTDANIKTIETPAAKKTTAKTTNTATQKSTDKKLTTALASEIDK